MMPYALRQVPSFPSWYREKKAPSRGQSLFGLPIENANIAIFVKKETNIRASHLLERSMNSNSFRVDGNNPSKKDFLPGGVFREQPARFEADPPVHGLALLRSLQHRQRRARRLSGPQKRLRHGSADAAPAKSLTS